MFRTLLMMLVAIFPLSAAAEGEILVQQPPVYQPGESASGMFVDQVGVELELHQVARRGPDQKMYILLTMIDEGGNVHARAVLDPDTKQGQLVSETSVIKVLATTCSSKTLYPIILGKVYECTSTTQVDDRVLDSYSRIEFDEVERDQQGRITGYCATSTDEDIEMIAKVRYCYSPDGKWVRSMHVLETVMIHKI